MVEKYKANNKAFLLRLKKMRKEIKNISNVSLDSRRPVELDQTAVGRLSRMDALQSQAMQLETERRRNEEIKRIDFAIKRIDDDVFGFCINCGYEIETKRLENDLTTQTCIDCAQYSEKNSKI